MIKTKPHAAVHFGAALAGPVFREIATKLYAQYVQGRKTAPLQLTPDSSSYQYAGYSSDVNNVFSTLHVYYVDSSYKNSWSWIYNNSYKPVMKDEKIIKNTVPDVKNMTLKDALYLLENMNLKVVVKGKGKVVAQDILPGTSANKNQTITLLLN